MNRREMIEAIGGVAGLTAAVACKPVVTVSRERPWAKRAEELFATEGHYADYVAWQEWLAAEMNRFAYDSQACAGESQKVFDGDLAEDIWNAYLTPIALYHLFCRAYDGDEPHA